MNKPLAQTSKLLVVIILALLILSAFTLSGFTIATMSPAQDVYLAIPNQGDETPASLVDVIKNGGFEEWEGENPHEGLARYWQGYHNGQAFFGFYNETWPEAVLNGEHAQLMEINQVEANILDRVIAIYQTVNVNPNSQYNLHIRAIMRSQAPAADRNKNEVEMHWGVDFSGEGDYDNVKEWHLMPLTEQYRLGSSGKYPEDIPLYYQVITGTVSTGDSSKVSLFIRGLKKFPTGTEVNFDLDDVSLVGPPSGGAPATATPLPEGEPTPTPESGMPTSGATLRSNISVGTVVLGGLVFAVLGVGAAISLLYRRGDT
ncbi:MAG: hypothetical protein JXM69_05090 [Anaerolineae bacterium]|nr:hypothetical protein [Anaerolineae bacterium]